jgi:hypothetical protein
MPATFMSICADLYRLARENNIEPPEMSLTFASESERWVFKKQLEKELSGLSMFPHGEVRFDSMHGIKFWLSVKPQ